MKPSGHARSSGCQQGCQAGSLRDLWIEQEREVRVKNAFREVWPIHFGASSGCPFSTPTAGLSAKDKQRNNAASIDTTHSTLMLPIHQMPIPSKMAQGSPPSRLFTREGKQKVSL